MIIQYSLGHLAHGHSRLVEENQGVWPASYRLAADIPKLPII